MSRYHLPIPQFEHDNIVVEARLAYGFDHAAGYFYQIYAIDEAIPVESKDSVFDGLSRGELLERFDALEVLLPDAHRAAIALDLPF